MRRVFALFFLLTTHLIVFSQIHEMGMFLGGSNTTSDLGSTHFIYSNWRNYKFNNDSIKYSQKLENFSKRFLTII